MMIFYGPMLGGGGGSSGSPPKLKKIKIPEAASLFEKYQKEGYDWSDAYQREHRGPLMDARDAAIVQALQGVKGEVPDQLLETLRSSGLGEEAGKLAGEEEDPYAIAREEGQPIGASVKRHRTFFQDVLNNPIFGTGKRDLTLTGPDVVRIAVANTGNINAFQQALYGTQLNNYASQQSQQAENFGALSSALTGLVNIIAKSNQSPYTDPYSNLFYYNQPTDFGNLPVSNLSDRPDIPPPVG